MDKAGIIISISIVIISVGLTVFLSNVTDIQLSGDEILSDTEKQEMIYEMLVTRETVDDVKETVEKIEETIEQGKKSSEESIDITKELITSKLPSRLVSIPQGTAIPGCESVNKCYDPPTLIIFKGGEVIWKNDDSSAHTVTSGNIIDGPDAQFDSGLISSDQTFSHRFDVTGEYDYFCMIHPWAKASITVR